MTAAADTAGQPAPARATASDWIAVVAGALGSLMATLDISIVNSALPTIQGEVGASGSEGTWIATSYLVAEIIVIPLAGWLERVFGLRRLLLGSITLFIGFSMLCGVSTTLTMMIIGRIGQGLTGGVLIPTAMTIVATRLPRAQQAVGTALFGATTLIGPVIGPVIGGWLTENASWHYAFFINLPIGIALLGLVMMALPYRRLRLDLFSEADWLGVFGMSLWLGAMTVVLEEGEREQWFSSALIIVLTIASVIGFAMLIAGQIVAKRPVIRLSLLLDRQFGSVGAMALVIGMMIYGTAYVIPQFLVIVAGYNALQAGQVLVLFGVPSILMMPIAPLLIRYIPIRLSVLTGMGMLALSAYLDAGLTALSTADAFTESQILRGAGTTLAMLFLNQAAIRAVPPDQASDAAGIYNAARNLGGSIALACIGVVQDQRMWLHSRRIEDTLSANSIEVQAHMAAQTDILGSSGAALRTLEATIQMQALVMTYNDLFLIVMVGILIVSPLAFFMRPLPKGAPVAAGH